MIIAPNGYVLVFSGKYGDFRAPLAAFDEEGEPFVINSEGWLVSAQDYADTEVTPNDGSNVSWYMETR